MAAITVIIPLYNKERQIKRAVCSVQRQTFQDWRLIVVDDGSTDNGPQIVREIEDSRIELIHQDNAGPGDARNAGIRLTKTPFVSFLDADDEWHPEFLEVTFTAIQENDVAMVSTSTLEFPQGYDYLDKLRENGLCPGIFCFHGNENPDEVENIISVITAKSTLICTETAKKYGGFYDKERCLYGEDRAFLWRIAFSESFMIIGRALAYYYTEDSELGVYTRALPLPPYLRDPKIFLDHCPQFMHRLVREVLDIQVLRQIQNQFRYSSRVKLLWLLLRHPGAKRYPKRYRECFKRLMPGFLTWQRIKNKFRSKMKIAFILPSFPCTSETFILNQIVEFIKMGHDVTIYAMSKPANSILHQDYITYRLDLKTKYAYSIPRRKFWLRTKAVWETLIHLFKSPKLFSAGIVRMFFSRSRPFNYKDLFFFFLLGSQKNDILFCHYGTMGNTVAFLKKLGLLGPLVTMFHGYDIRLGIEKGGEIYKELFDVGQRFLAISEYNKRHLLEFGVPTHKLLVHPVGINVEDFPLSNNQVDGTVKILTVARLVPEKGLEYAIQAISKLLQQNPDCHIQYNIIGEGPLEDSLKKIVSTFNLSNSVHFLGAKNQGEIKRYLAGSNIFLLSSVAEALPVCLMEAQASGLPVVATNVGSINQIVKNGESGFLVPPGNPLLLCEKIEYLIHHQSSWPQFGKSGRANIQKKFNNKILCKKLLEHFNDCLKNSSYDM